MRTKFILCAFIFLLLQLHFTLAQEKKQVVLKAQLWPYSSLCDFPETENQPGAISYNNVSISVRGCEDLQQELGKPSAVRLTVINLSDSEIECPFNGLKSVFVKMKNGKVATSIAMRHKQKNPVGSGYYYSFANKVDGEMKFIIDPHKSCDVIFLFPKASAGDQINIEGFASGKITD